MPEPSVTVVMTYRERFSIGVGPLDTMLADRSLPFEFVIVVGKPPGSLRQELERRAKAHGLRLIVENQFLRQSRARNIGLRHARGKYVAFVDNDVVVTPGWLKALVDAAEATGAAMVGPVQLEGPLEQQRIHCFGGTCNVVEINGARVFNNQRDFLGERLDAPSSPLLRAETELCEGHCMLIRKSFLDQAGPWDERLSTVLEYADLCLRARGLGLGIFREPRSVVTYLVPEKLKWEDLRFFDFRWDLDATLASLAHFAEKWGAEPGAGDLGSTLGFVRYHRRLPLRALRADAGGPLSLVGKARRAAKGMLSALRRRARRRSRKARARYSTHAP